MLESADGDTSEGSVGDDEQSWSAEYPPTFVDESVVCSTVHKQGDGRFGQGVCDNAETERQSA